LFREVFTMFTLPAGSKPFLLGACAGALLMLWAGFDGMGWKTASNAASLGKRQADEAVVSALASICDANFRKAANLPARLAALEKVDRYSRGETVWKAGWATLPGATEPNQEVGRACAELIIPPGKS
jgi:hypothetical protein